MSNNPPQVDEVFDEAVRLVPGDERERFLAEVCGDDAELKQRVERLLRAVAEAGSFLETPAQDPSPTHDQPITEKPGTQIGPYKLLQQLGEGGMGVVYMAEQKEPVKRRVALKIIKPGMDTRQVIARFEAERQALAMMDHPNVAKVLDAGATESGRPYFVMELVNGVSVTQYCDEQHLTPKERLELFVPICQAVQHAHQKGIIHRDLKPSNILVAEYDHRAVPKIIDFGVAKATSQTLTERTMFTQLGQIVGTLEYMSPEQAKRNQLDVDTRSDIYSLGVVLYELLTGETPFDRERLRRAAFDEMLRIIREEEPSKPSTKVSSSLSLPSIAANRRIEPAKLGSMIRGELDWIVLKAMEKDRGRRYETASKFAEDVQHYLNDEAVVACPPSAAYRFRTFVRRNKPSLVTAAVVILALVSGTAAATWQAIRATKAEQLAEARLTAESDARRDAERERETAESARRAEAEQRRLAQKSAEGARMSAAEAERQKKLAIDAQQRESRQRALAEEQELLARRRYYAAQINLARQAWDSGQPSRVIELLETQRPMPSENDLRTFGWYWLWGLCHEDLLFTIQNDRSDVANSAVFSPDGKVIATGDMWGRIQLWDAATGRRRGSMQADGGGFYQIAYSPDGRYIAQPKGGATIWDAATQRVAAILRDGGETAVAFSPNGKLLATGSYHVRGDVKIWEVGSWRQLLSIPDCGGSDRVLNLNFSPDSKRLCVTTGWPGNGGRTIVLDITSTPPIETLRLPPARMAVFSPQGETIATSLAKDRAVVELWDATTGALVATSPTGADRGARALTFSPDGRFLAYDSGKRSFTVWEIASGATRSFTNRGMVCSLAFGPDGANLASSSDDGATRLWSLAPVTKVNAFPQLPPLDGQHSIPLAFSPDGKSIVVGNQDGSVVLYGKQDGELRNKFAGPSGWMGTVAFSPDGKTLASARGEYGGISAGEFKLWDLETGTELASLGGHTIQPHCVCFSPDRETFASGGFDGTIVLWDVASRQARMTLKLPVREQDRAVLAITFSPDGSTLAVVQRWGTIWFFDPQTGQEKLRFRELVNSFGDVRSLAFSPDGRYLATGDSAGRIRLRDPSSTELLTTLKGHSGAINSIAFLDKGATLASGGGDGTLKLWDVVTAQERLTMPGGYLAVAPDGQTIVTEVNGQIHVHRASTHLEARAFRMGLEHDDPKSIAPTNLLELGDHHWASVRLADAESAYRLAFARSQELVESYPDGPQYERQLGRASWCLTRLLRSGGAAEEALQIETQQKAAIDAWLGSDEMIAKASDWISVANRLCVGPDWNDSNIGPAIEFAQRAVDAAPSHGVSHHVLALASFRAGDWAGTITSMEKSIEFRNGGDAFNWYFLAMAHWQLGNKTMARDWFNQAATWTDNNQPDNVGLQRLHDEATRLLFGQEIPQTSPDVK